MTLSLRSVGAILVVAAVTMGGGVIANHYYTLSKTPMVATVLPEPRTIAAFALLDGQGQPFTNQRLQGHWTLLFFGFTHCPMICPTTMASLHQMYQTLLAQKQQPMPQVVFVSVDPDRDNYQRTGQYAAGFNPQFIGATGSSQQLEKLTAALGVLSMKVQNPGEKTYTIDHSGAILLVDPAGKLHALFSMPHNADAIARDFGIISHQHS